MGAGERKSRDTLQAPQISRLSALPGTLQTHETLWTLWTLRTPWTPWTPRTPWNPRTLLTPWLCSRALMFGTPKLRYPQSAVHIVKEDQAVVRLTSPAKRHIGPVSFGIPGPKMGDLTALAVEITSKLS